MSLYLVSEGLVCFGLFSGTYQSLKLLQRHERHSHCQHILKFWTVLGAIIVFGQYVERFIAWLPFYYWVKCLFVGGLLMPKAQLYVVAFESAVLPAVDAMTNYYLDTCKPKIEQVAGMHGHWLHQAAMNVALPSLSLEQLNKLEEELTARLAQVKAAKVSLNVNQNGNGNDSHAAN